MDVAWLDDEEQQAWRALMTVHRRLMARLDDDLQRTTGLSLPDYEVLVHLSEAPCQAMRMSELAERLVLSPSGLTRRLDGLVRDHLVARQACPSDGRGSLAVLTVDGRRRLEEAAPAHLASVRTYVVDRLDRDDLLGLGSALTRIGDALDEASGQRGAPPSCPA